MRRGCPPPPPGAAGGGGITTLGDDGPEANAAGADEEGAGVDAVAGAGESPWELGPESAGVSAPVGMLG